MQLKYTLDSLDKVFADVCTEEEIKDLRGCFAAYATGAKFVEPSVEGEMWDNVHAAFIFAVQHLHDFLEKA